MSRTRPHLVLIAAVARNRAIGRDNRLLWRLKSDMAHFRAATMGRPVLMGRRTWDSIGRPLPGREIIVLTRAGVIEAAGVHVARTLQEALELAAERAEALGSDRVMVAGGAEIYAETIGRADALDLTEVDLAPEGDAFFPPVDPARWREIAREEHEAGPGDEASFAFVAYARR